MASSTTSVQQKSSIRSLMSANLFRNQGVLVFIVLIVVVLVGAIIFGSNFLGAYNITTMLVFNSMFALISLGMTFVIITGGIDLSVSSVAVLTSMLAAWFSRFGLLPAIFVPVLIGVLIGLFNGWTVGKLNIQPFVATLVTFMAARGLALIMPKIFAIYIPGIIKGLPIEFWNKNVADYSIAIDRTKPFQAIVGDVFGIPIPLIIIVVAYAIGALLLQYTRFGRITLAVGGNEEATRLMGLPVVRTKVLVYAMSGGLAGLAGVILAARSGTALPTEAVGWELQAISAVVVGGTLLTGGKGSVITTLIGVLLLGLIFNLLNFINVGGFSLTVYWQAVVRGVFLFIVVLLQSSWLRRNA
jgi:ribose/xylose/arabinose/galactoside ABC-type transport system permease subunit